MRSEIVVALLSTVLAAGALQGQNASPTIADILLRGETVVAVIDWKTPPGTTIRADGAYVVRWLNGPKGDNSWHAWGPSRGPVTAKAGDAHWFSEADHPAGYTGCSLIHPTDKKICILGLVLAFNDAGDLMYEKETVGHLAVRFRR